MRRSWGLVAICLGGCSLYFDEGGAPPGPTPSPPVDPPMATGTAVPYRTLAVGPGDVMDVAVDDAYVYWLVNHQSSNESDVFRVAKVGGASEHVAHVDGRVYSFALDDTYVYLPVWVQALDGGPFLRVPKAGGSADVIEDHLRYLELVTVHDDGVYTAPLVDETTIDYQLWRYPRSGGPHEVLVDGLRGPESVAFDTTKLYVATSGDSMFHEAPVAGGASDEPMPALDALHVRSDGDRVYLMSNAIEECMTGRISAWQPGTSQLTDLGPIQSCPGDLALASDSLIAVETEAGTVLEFPLDGSGRRTLVSGLRAPIAIAAEADGSSIYWGDFVTGEIDRLDR